MLTPIEDPADPRIEPYRQVRERDLAGRGGVFIIEGEVVLRTAARLGRCRILSLLLDQKRVAGLADLLAALDPAIPVHTAPRGVMDQIVGFPIHRGVLALGRRPEDPDIDSLLAGLGPRALVLALFGIGNHDNMGGIFRNAAAFGTDAVLLARDCCDPLYRKAIRVSVGASLVVPFARCAPGRDPLEALAANGFEALSLTPSGETPLDRLIRPDRAALLLGAEGPGLPSDILGRTRTLAIPMAGGFDSLNVAVACGIALHHLAANRRAGPASEPPGVGASL